MGRFIVYSSETAELKKEIEENATLKKRIHSKDDTLLEAPEKYTKIERDEMLSEMLGDVLKKEYALAQDLKYIEAFDKAVGKVENALEEKYSDKKVGKIKMMLIRKKAIKLVDALATADVAIKEAARNCELSSHFFERSNKEYNEGDKEKAEKLSNDAKDCARFEAKERRIAEFYDTKAEVLSHKLGIEV